MGHVGWGQGFENERDECEGVRGLSYSSSRDRVGAGVYSQQNLLTTQHFTARLPLFAAAATNTSVYGYKNTIIRSS